MSFNATQAAQQAAQQAQQTHNAAFHSHLRSHHAFVHGNQAHVSSRGHGVLPRLVGFVGGLIALAVLAGMLLIFLAVLGA